MYVHIRNHVLPRILVCVRACVSAWTLTGKHSEAGLEPRILGSREQENNSLHFHTAAIPKYPHALFSL